MSRAEARSAVTSVERDAGGGQREQGRSAAGDEEPRRRQVELGDEENELEIELTSLRKRSTA